MTSIILTKFAKINSIQKISFTYLQNLRQIMKFLGYILRLILRPISGWEDISECSETRYDWLRKGLFPMLGILAVCCFIHGAYGHFELSKVLQNAIIEFVSYFATLFIADEFLCWYGGKYLTVTEDNSEREKLFDRIRIFNAFNIGILVLISIIKNICPVDNTIFDLLPYCIIFVISYSGEYLGIEENKRTIFYVLAWLSMVIPVLVISQVFNSLLPQ